MLLAVWLVALPCSVFGREVPPRSVSQVSLPTTEACISGTVGLATRGNVQDAGATVSVASMLFSQEARHAYEHAEKALAQGKLKDAKRALEKAVAIYPKSAVAWCFMGTLHEEKLQLETASADYSQALSADSRMLAAYLGLARIAFRNKRWQEVVKLTDQLVRVNAAAFPVAYLYNAAANFNLGDLTNAESSARKFQSLDMEHERPQAYLLLADILAAERDYAGAAEEERIFLTIVPNPCDVPNGRDANSIMEEIKILEGLSIEKVTSTMSSHLTSASTQTPFR
jgi:tetratricopeptide (TPR) repeat protein